MSVNKYNSTTGNLERLDGYTVDSTPTSGSGNPVSSGGVFTALDGKQNKAWTEIISGLTAGDSSAAASGEYDLNIANLKTNYSELIAVIGNPGSAYAYNSYASTIIVPTVAIDNTSRCIFYNQAYVIGTSDNLRITLDFNASGANKVRAVVYSNGSEVINNYKIFAR